MPNGERRCPYCGETIRAEAIKCRHCGEMLEEDRRGGSPYAQRTGGGRFPDLRSDLPEPANATTIFVLGLLGLITCQILGIIAYFMGKTYKQQVAHGLVRSNGMADAGYIMGLISVILLVVTIVVMLIMFLFVGIASVSVPNCIFW